MTSIILIHGFPGGKSDFYRLREVLVRRGATMVYTPDLLGFGELQRGSLGFGDLWIDAQAAALDATIGAQDVDYLRPSIFYGHDFGVMVAIALATRAPDRCRGLVLSSGNLFAEPQLAPPMRLLNVPLAGSVVEALLFSRPANRLMAKSGVKAGGALPRANTQAELEAIRTIFATALRRRRELFPDVQAMASRLTVPVTLVWGEKDPFFPGKEVAKRVSELFPRWQVRVEAGVGHFPQIEVPEIVAEEIMALL